tara:strand:- start:267 stop:392 length:126 start_codon:yes stop_codon:yes gene_type:complete
MIYYFNKTICLFRHRDRRIQNADNEENFHKKPRSGKYQEKE